MDTIDALQELEIGNKYTLVTFDIRGWPNCTNFVLRAICPTPKGMVIMVIKPQRSPLRNILMHKDKQFVLWNDWINPNCEIIVSTYIKDSSFGPSKMGRTWARFDTRYLIKARNSVIQMPIIWNINEPKTEQLHDLCYIHNLDS